MNILGLVKKLQREWSVGKENFVESILKSIKLHENQIRAQWFREVDGRARHFFVDGLLNDEDCIKIFKEFPVNAEGFLKLKSFREKKNTTVELEKYHPILADITYAFQDPRVVNLISNIIELKNIEPDPSLYAGGLSMMFEGDYLNPHLDNSHDGKRERYRRLNLLYYVSPDWRLENGGNLELWDEGLLNSETILACANRLVVMETNRYSWHSVSRVMASNPRCCVSNYYFSEESPDGSSYHHVTSFSGRPDEKVKRFAAIFDNASRNMVAKIFGVSRGRTRK